MAAAAYPQAAWQAELEAVLYSNLLGSIGIQKSATPVPCRMGAELLCNTQHWWHMHLITCACVAFRVQAPAGSSPDVWSQLLACLPAAGPQGTSPVPES